MADDLEEEDDEADLPAEGSTADEGVAPALGKPAGGFDLWARAGQLAQPLTLPPAPYQPPTYGDYGHAIIGQGIGAPIRFTGQAIEYAKGKTGVGDWLQEVGSGIEKSQADQMTPSALQNIGSSAFESDHPGSTIALQAMGSVPMLGVSMGITGIVGKVAMAGIGALARLGFIPFAEAVGESAAVPVGAVAASRGAAFTAGVTPDVMQMIGQTYDQISEGIAKATEDKLRAESPEYVRLRESMNDNEARVYMQREMAGVFPLIAGGVTALTAKFGIEGQFADRITSNVVGAGMLRGALKGISGEGFQELLENSAQEYLAERALIEAGKQKQYDWKKIADQGITGAAAGALLGGVTGALIHRAPHIPAVDDTKPPPTTPPAASIVNDGKTDSDTQAAITATLNPTGSPPAQFPPTSQVSTTLNEDEEAVGHEEPPPDETVKTQYYQSDPFKAALRGPAPVVGQSTPGGTGVEAPPPAQEIPVAKKQRGKKAKTVEPTTTVAVGSIAPDIVAAITPPEVAPQPQENAPPSPAASPLVQPAPAVTALPPSIATAGDGLQTHPGVPQVSTPVEQQAPAIPPVPTPVQESPTVPEPIPSPVVEPAAGETATAPAAPIAAPARPSRDDAIMRGLIEASNARDTIERSESPDLHRQSIEQTVREMAPEISQAPTLSMYLGRDLPAHVDTVLEKARKRLDELRAQEAQDQALRQAQDLDRASVDKTRSRAAADGTDTVAGTAGKSDRQTLRIAKKQLAEKGEEAPMSAKLRAIGDIAAARQARIDEARAAGAAESRQAVERAKLQAFAAARDAETAKMKTAIEAHPAPEIRTGETKESVKDRIGKMLKTAAAAGLKIPEKMNKNYSPEKNLLIFGRKVREANVRAGDIAHGLTHNDFISNEKLVKSGEGAHFVANTIGDGVFSKESLRGTKAIEEAKPASTIEGPEELESNPPGWEHAEGLPPNPEFPRSAPAKGGVTLTTPHGDVFHVVPEDVHTVKSFTGKVAQLSARTPGSPQGLFKLIQFRVMQSLSSLVGDVPVYHVPGEVVRQMMTKRLDTAPRGLWVGTKAWSGGAIYISKDIGDIHQIYQTALHEAAHAATAFAIKNNLNNAMDNFQALHDIARSAMSGYHYGFENLYEFVAEAYGNPEFQRALNTIALPARLQAELRAMSLGRELSLWDLTVAHVQNLLNLSSLGRQGRTVLDGVLTLAPDVMMPTEERSAAELPQGTPFAGQTSFDDPFGVLPMMQPVKDAHQALLMRANFLGNLRTNQAKLFDYVKSTMHIRREGSPMFGGPESSWDKMINMSVSTGPLARKIAEGGNQIAAGFARYAKANAGAAKEIAHIAWESTLRGADPRVPLSDKANSHISKKSPAGAAQRTAHIELSARYNALEPDAKKHLDAMANYYEKHQNEMQRLVVKNTLETINEKEPLVLPPGEDLDTVTKWVTSGEIDKGPTTQTPRDQALHAMLGTFGKRLQAASDLRVVKGVYFPLMRRGDFVVTSQHTLTDVPSTARQDGNRLVFDNQKDATDYLNKTKEVTKTTYMWVDPQTGDRVNKEDLIPNKTPGGPDVTPVQRTIVEVQNHHADFFENKAKALAHQKQLVASKQYDTVSGVYKKDELHAGSAIMPLSLTQMVNALNQKGGDEAAKKEARAAIIDIALRNMPGTRIQQHRLPRRRVLGFSTDLLSALKDYNISASNHIAKLTNAHALGKLVGETQKYIHDNKNSGNLRAVERRQALFTEMQKRMTDVSDNVSSNWLSRVQAISFLTYLGSPAANLINMTQPGMVTYPVLAGRHGPGNAGKELIRSYATLGGFRELYGGLRDTALAAKEVVTGAQERKPAQSVRDRIKNQPDAALLNRMADAAEATGDLSPGAGLELESGEIGKTGFDLALHRVVNIARAMPEHIEVMNRWSSGIAAARLEMRHPSNANLTQEAREAKAIRYALDVMESTQFDYSKRGTGRVFNSKYAAVPFQFKKYGAGMAQLIGKNINDAFSGDSPEVRKEARGMLATMGMVTMAMAGIGSGLPWEPAKALLLASWMMGLSKDWESYQQDFYQKMKDVLSDKPAELVMYGLPRLLGINVASRIGLDTMLMFGSPKNNTSVDLKGWLFDMMAGAPTGAIASGFQAISSGIDGEYQDAAKNLPWPKVIKDSLKAYQGYTEGRQTKTGKQLAPQLSGPEALAKAFGLQPASEARQFEAGGSGRDAIIAKQDKADRTTMMNTWIKASGSAREAQWQKIKSWNADHDKPIDMGALRKLEVRRKKENADAKREVAGAD